MSMKIRQVAADRGLGWITEGFSLFLKDWGIWVVMFLIYVALMFVCSLVPFLGAVASPLLASLLAGGLMSACREQAAGGELKVDLLFHGFSENTRQLLMIGVVNLLASAAIGVIAVLAIGSSLMSLQLEDLGEVLSFESLVGTALIALAVLAVLVPLAMATWFAPALVMLASHEAVDAMKLSFLACLRNMWPFLVYGLVLLVLFLIASIPMGLGLLALGPTIVVSIYLSYRDLFEA